MSDLHCCDRCKGIGPCVAELRFPTPTYVGIPIEVRETAPVKYGRAKERAAIVAWLRAKPSGYYGPSGLAQAIERGEHLGSNDE